MNRPLHNVAGAIEPLERRAMLAAQFAEVIDNPFFPLIPGTTLIYRGTDSDGAAFRSRVTVTGLKAEIMGVQTSVVREREYQDGELVEDTRDYFAQDLAGNVWYFGEDSREIEDEEVTGTEGSWRAGVNGARPGIIMRAAPAVGDEYQQEGAPGVAEDAARVISLNGRAMVPFATFGDCVQTQEFNPLDAEGGTEHKFYAPGIGLVKAQEVDGTEVARLAYVQLAPEAFDDTIDNPLFPLVPGTTYIYRGTDEDGQSVRTRFEVTDQTRVITGVTATVVRDREFVAGELVEDTLDFFAQDKAGNVWYFGEDSKEIEDGEVVSTEGSWLAGENGARAGIIMRARPGVGDEYFQENAPGVAVDQARVLSYGNRVVVPVGTFGNALKTEEFTALEPGVLDNKFYAPGVGFVMSEAVGGGEVLRLAYILFV
jgi:hypothetical protein